MYNKDTEYNVKYVTKDGKEETKQITPSEDMSKPQMIMKLKEEDKNFFKLIENVEYITPEELKKLHKDYKSTVGDIIRFSKYRGQDPEKVRQKYKDLGYDETDPMIVTSDGKGGTILKPVKVKKEENKMSKTLFDYLEEHSFEGVDIQDTVYDMTCWFEFTIEDADSDPFDMFMSKLAKSLHIDFEDVNKTVVVDLTNWVTKNYDKLEEIFDLSGEDKESNIEEIVGSIMPGLLSGYTTNSVYKELADNMIVESKEVVEENEDEFEELENLDEEVTDVEEEKEETLDGKDVTDTFKNYKAFEANFGPIKIVKNSYDKNYKVYKVNEEDAGNYIYYSDNKDNIEGWLYGAVQAANGKFNKLKNTNEAVNKSILNEEDEETLDEVINRAHQEEISAIDTYDTVLSKTDESTDAKLIEMINEIKKDEEDHKTLLQHYIETGEVWTDEDLNKTDSEDVEVEQDDTEELEESKETIKISEDELKDRYEDFIKNVAPEKKDMSYEDFKTTYLRDTVIDGKHLELEESKELKESDEENGIIELGNDFQTILDKDTNSYIVLYRGSEIDSSLKDDEYYEACKTLDGIKNFVKKLKIQTTGKGFAKKSRIVKDLTESKEFIKEELPKQAPLDSLLDMVTEATNITELEEIADSILDSELKEDLLECIDDEDAKAYGEDIYFNTVKLNMQNIIEDYINEQ